MHRWFEVVSTQRGVKGLEPTFLAVRERLVVDVRVAEEEVVGKTGDRGEA